MKYVASRLSEGNKIFPAEIHVEPTGVTVKIPGLFGGKSQFIGYENISSIAIDTPMIGYSSITFFHGGNKVYANGFTKKEAQEIKTFINEGKANAKSLTVRFEQNTVKEQVVPPVQQELPAPTIVNKAPGVLSTLASTFGTAATDMLREGQKEREEARNSKVTLDNKIEDIALISFSQEKDDILNKLNYLSGLGSSKPDKNLKSVIIDKMEFGILKLRGIGASNEAEFFERKLEPLKKKGLFGL